MTIDRFSTTSQSISIRQKSDDPKMVHYAVRVEGTTLFRLFKKFDNNSPCEMGVYDHYVRAQDIATDDCKQYKGPNPFKLKWVETDPSSWGL